MYFNTDTKYCCFTCLTLRCAINLDVIVNGCNLGELSALYKSSWSLSLYVNFNLKLPRKSCCVIV